MPIKVFWLESTERVRRYLRRYSSSDSSDSDYSYHSAMVRIADGLEKDQPESAPMDDTRWPTYSDRGYEFKDSDNWQLFYRNIYTDPEGNEHTLDDAPIGAMWDASWLSRDGGDGDGIHLMVKTPGGDWYVDGRATNCSLPKDKMHRCWVRHGNPKDPQGAMTLHVDKNGLTCRAGAGSIQMKDYHGFLHNGELTDT